ncbi:MAG: hypothetical protein ABSG72_03145 [Candidatus Sulfotelmatobacter sp.]
MFCLLRNARLYLTLAAALLPLLCTGCGSSSNSSNTVSQAQAQAVSQQVSLALDQALTAAFSSSSSDALAERGAHHSLATVMNDLHPDSSSTPCTATNLGETCDWTVSYSGSCPGGGTISVDGGIDGSLTSSGSGSIATALTITPTSCSVSSLILNGDPDIAIAGSITFSDDAVVYPITFTETGGVSWGSSSSQVCTINVSDSITSATACTITGTVCGQTISGTC